MRTTYYLAPGVGLRPGRVLGRHRTYQSEATGLLIGGQVRPKLLSATLSVSSGTVMITPNVESIAAHCLDADQRGPPALAADGRVELGLGVRPIGAP